MKNNFQVILISVFAFFILLGIASFALYKAKDSTNTNVNLTAWGTIDVVSFENFLSKMRIDLSKDVKIKYVQKNILTIDAELVEAIASGIGPDIVLLPQNLLVRYSDKVYPIPATSLPERLFKDTFVQEAEIYLTADGAIGLPFFIDPLVMYWNRDMFADVGVASPPTKWLEFPDLASKMSKVDNNANIIQSAVSLGGYKNINNAKAIISSIIMQAGSPIIATGSNGEVSSYLDSRSSVDTKSIEIPAYSALRFYTDYSNPKKSVYSWNNALPSSKQMFLSGDLAVYFGKASEISDIKEKNPNLNFDVAMLPQILDSKNKITFGDIYGFLILKSSPNIVPAFNAISTLVGADTVPVFLGFNNFAPARRDLIARGVSDSAKSVFYNSALISRSWLDPNSSKTDIIFQDMIDNITTGRERLEGAVQKASEELNNLL
ncbi:MAG: extracellular solute-binding protein [Candidatus Paceibacterota bacterium]|jgi:ABC-type glycerol-3-phosphate transport system substrate-binding protein